MQKNQFLKVKYSLPEPEKDFITCKSQRIKRHRSKNQRRDRTVIF